MNCKKCRHSFSNNTEDIVLDCCLEEERGLEGFWVSLPDGSRTLVSRGATLPIDCAKWEDCTE
jgi:hypothetical protein